LFETVAEFVVEFVAAVEADAEAEDYEFVVVDLLFDC